LHEYTIEALAAALDMSADQIEQRIAISDTFGVILDELGLASDAINNLIVGARTEALQRAVEDGSMDQEGADWMLDRISQMQSYLIGPKKEIAANLKSEAWYHDREMRTFSQ
jgi:hypothetical protein